MKENISLISLGCAKNLVDSEVLIGGLKSENYNLVDSIEDSDSVIINTCGFLDLAREESVDTILECAEYRKTGKIQKLIVMGCFSERYGDDLQNEIPEVDKFFGTADHAEILTYLTGKDFKRDDPNYFRSLLTPKHYAYLKIAEGCDNVCSFCSIPMMRGLQKSSTLEQNLIEAQMLADRGVKELLIIAQDTTSYGWDLNPKSSLHELCDVLNNVKGLEWIRLHYAHPAHLHKEMIKKFGQLEKLIPYVDMPTQHGSDSILKNMKRGLNCEGIKKRISQLREVNDKISIRTSIIVGFPNETEQDFKDLYKYIEEVKFDRLGVFKYSEEEGTSAAIDYKDNIPAEVKQNRYDEIMILQQQINLNKNLDRVGNEEKVIVDVVSDEGWSLARSYRDAPEIDNYVKINKKLIKGNFYNVKIKEAYEYDVLGDLIEK